MIASKVRRRDTGQSLVEFAIVMPVLLAVVIGIFEFGRAWNVRQVITNVAREGARLAVVPSSSESAVRATIDSGLSAAALNPASSTVTIQGMGGGTGSPSTVQVAYPYTFTFLGPVVSLLKGSSVPGGTITLTTSISMRNE